MNIDADSKGKLIKECSEDVTSQNNHQQPQLISSMDRLKKKHLGLSNSAEANRFRLTFDDTADDVADRNIELAQKCTLFSSSLKSPSCIGKGSGLPRSGCNSQFSKNSGASSSIGNSPIPTNIKLTCPGRTYPDTRSTPTDSTYPYISHAHTDLISTYSDKTSTPTSTPSTTPTCTKSLEGDFHKKQQYPSASQDVLCNKYSMKNEQRSPTNKHAIYLSSPDTRNTKQEEQQLDDLLPMIDSQLNINLDDSGEDQSKVTICISNSQQSCIPYTPDSPTFDLDSEIKQNQPGACFRHHQNNNQCVSELCFMDSPESIPMTEYTSSMKGPNIYYSEKSDGLDNRPIYPDLGNASHSLVSQQDTLSAAPLQGFYRNHVFFSHCPEDKEWVEQIMSHLEAPPFNYTCSCSSPQDDVDQATMQQRILCAAMLSERVVLVLSKRYVEETWCMFENTLKQLTQVNLHNQRVMGVLLEDCQIPETLGDLYFFDSSNPDFLYMFTKRLKTNMTNGTILTFCRLHVKVGWDSFLVPADATEMEIPPSLSANGIGMETTEFEEIVAKVSGIIKSSNKLPWLLSAQPLVAILLATGLWVPAFIATLVMHVDEDSGIALPARLMIFLFPLLLVAAGYLIKWRRSYWLTKIVRLLIQNCVDVNQAFYFQGRPLFVTASHVRANVFSIYFVYFDATDCVQSVDLLLFTCMEEDWEKLLKLIKFYTRDENYLSRMSISERLTVMMSSPYLVKLVRQALPNPPQQRHVPRLLCLCQFTEECISRFAHGLDREDVPGLAELFTRHMPGKVSGSAARRVQEELFHANHGLVP